MADIYKFLELYYRESFIEGILICISSFIDTVILNSQFINSNRCSNKISTWISLNLIKYNDNIY